jgi:hypothetical protein
MRVLRVRVRMKEISTSIHFHFQYFYLSIFVLFFFSTFLLSIKVRRIIGPDLDPARGPEGASSRRSVSPPPLGIYDFCAVYYAFASQENGFAPLEIVSPPGEKNLDNTLKELF